jgi:hypothetical protein
VIARLLLANLLELGAGIGVAALLRLPWGTSYLAGLGVVGILSAHLALVHVTFGWEALVVTCALALGLGKRFGELPAISLRRPRLGLVGWVSFLALAVLFVHAWSVFRAKPLDDYDAWAMWGMKAKALTLFGWADPHLFASSGAQPLHLDYPLLVPSLEAVAARATGGFDSQAIHLQFLLLGVAGLAAFYAYLHKAVSRRLTWIWLVVLGAAPAFGGQLLTAYADIPLALFVGAAVLAGAAWVGNGAPGIPLASVFFLACAALTKNEGVVYTAALLIAFLVATRRLRAVVITGLLVEAALVPWQVWLAARHVHSDTILTVHSLEVRHPGIAPLALHALLRPALSLETWPLILPLFGIAVLLARATHVAVFAAAFVVVSFFGLDWIYVVSPLEWSNYLSYSGDRVIDGALVGAAVLTPLLASQRASRIGTP